MLIYICMYVFRRIIIAHRPTRSIADEADRLRARKAFSQWFNMASDPWDRWACSIKAPGLYCLKLITHVPACIEAFAPQ